MRKSNFLRKLLSGVCCLAMLVTMLPIIPAAAADAAVLFEDNFNSYSANADLPLGGAADKFALGKVERRTSAQTPGSYSITTVDGKLKISSTDVVDSGDVGEVYAGVKTAQTFNGSYTVTFDWMQESTDVYCTIIYLAGTEVRVRMQNPGNSSAIYNTIFFVKNGNKYLKNPDTDEQFKFGAAFGTWYTFEYHVDADSNKITLNVYEQGGSEVLATYTLDAAPAADKPLEFSHFCVQGSDESGKTSTCYIDNVKVVSGLVEREVPQGPAAGTTIGGAAMSNFSDAAEITYTKAAEITAGLGLFAGADGKFMPKGTVTRAQMATIIVKMLNGSDVNADTFKGTGKFNDVAGFEGGWAEGYVNWCSTLGIVSGYGDGSFRPGNQVTAAEAATMILNALKVDAGEGTWPHTVMAKAEELDMFDDLSPKPANDQALTREELAVMALVGLEYSPEGTTGYEYNGVVYDNYFDALLIAGDASKITPAAKDTLASTVYEMKTVEGYITGNQATGLDYTEINGLAMFNIETGLEHIGHYVEVYYAEEYESEDEPGLTYTIYDETKVYVVKDEDIDTAKEYKALFGKTVRVSSNGVAMFDGQYVMADDLADAIPGYVPGSYAPMGTYFVNKGAVVAYMEPVTVYATKVLAVEKVSGYETIELNLPNMPPISNSENDDQIVEYKGIADDDYVTYTMVGPESDPIYVLTETKPVTGAVTKVTTNEDGDRVITVKGKQYVAFGAANNTTGLTTDEPTDFNATYTFYVTADGKYVGYEKNTGAADLTNTVFVLGQLQIVEADSYGKRIRRTVARGVDLDGNEVTLTVKIEDGTYEASTKTFTPTSELTEQVDALTAGFFRVEDAVGRDAKKEGLKVLSAISSTYDEKENPIYSGRSNIGVDKTVSPYNFGVGGMLVNRNTSAPYLMLEGDVNQSTALTATVKKGSWSTFINNTGATLNRYLLLSRADNGTQMLEAMVMHVTGEGALDTEAVYITEQAVASASRNTDGWEYTVYNYKTGAAKQITMENPIDGGIYTGSGYYKIAPIENSECKMLVEKIPDVWECGASVNRDTVDERVEEDGLYNENVFLDQVFQYITNNELSTTLLENRGSLKYTDSRAYRLPKADGAVVIDTRSEAEIESFGLGKITDLARVESLTARNEDLVILMDLCFDTSGNKVLTVFIKEMYYDASSSLTVTERNGVMYINGRPVADNCEIIDTRAYSTPVTDVDGLKDLCDNYDVTGTYTVSDGKIDSFTITSAREHGVYVVDDYERYDNGNELTVALAASKEIYYGSINKTTKVSSNTASDIYPSITVKSGVAGSSSKVLEMNGGNVGEGRQYLYLAKPDGGYTLDFDLMRPAGSGYCNIKLCTGIELRIRYASGKLGVYGLSGSNTYYLNTDGTTSTSGDNAIAINNEGDWYHLTIMMDSNGVLTIKTTDPDGVEYVHQIELPSVDLCTVYYDNLTKTGSPAVTYIDNLNFVAWDGEYGVDKDGAEITEDNGAYFVNGIPVSDAVVLTNESSKTINSIADAMAFQAGNAVCVEYVMVDGEITELIITAVALKLPAKLLYVEPLTVDSNKVLTAEADAWVLDPVDGGTVGEKVTLPVGTKVTVTNGTARRNVDQHNMYVVSVDGEDLSIMPYAFARGGDYKNRVGRHNEIVSFTGGELVMVDAHAYSDTNRSNDQDGSPCYDYAANSSGVLEAPLTLTGIANDQVVYTDNGTTTVGALAARTDARIVLDYFMDENGEPVFFFLYQDDEAPFTYPLYVPAEDDVLLALAPLTITGTTSNKGFRGDFEVIEGSVPAGTKVHVRFLDIFGVNGAAVAAGTMPVGLYAGTVSAKLGHIVLTQLEGEVLDSTAIAALTSATVMDMRTSFITECPAAITDLAGLKAVAANSSLKITASLYTVGGSELVVVSDVTIVTMDIPAGALLHSMGPFSNTATTGWFIVLDNAGDTSLVPGQQYFFEYDNTYVIKTSRVNDARFIYATQAGMPSITNGYGVTASVDGSTKYWGGTAGWGAAGSAVHKSNFSFHRWVNGVTNNQDGTYTLTLGQAHANSSSCTTAGFTCYNGNKQGTVTLSASTVIVDTRNPEQGAMTLAEFAALYAQAGAGKLLVNSYFADGASDTTVEYLVIMPESNS